MKTSPTKKIAFVLSILSFLAYSSVVYATDYKLLAPLPNVTNANGTTNISTYLPGAFNLVIALAVAMAFVMIVFGGITYAVSDSITGRQDGKNFLTNAIYGLIIAIGAYTIIYTINPKMLNFNLDIWRPASQTPVGTVTPVTGTAPTGAVRCLGTDCVYSYTNGSGTIVSYKNCFNCSLYSSFSSLKFKTTFVDGKTAQINTNLGNRLVGLQGMSGTPQFTITESWPPTVNHKDQLQYQGASVDISIASPSASSITSFLQNAASKNLYAKYEVASDAQRNAYIAAGVPATGIIVVPYVTGEHFSVR